MKTVIKTALNDLLTGRNVIKYHKDNLKAKGYSDQYIKEIIKGIENFYETLEESYENKNQKD